MEPSELAYRSGRWLRNQGPDADVVLSTRVRLARNVEGFAFPGRIGETARHDLEARLREWIDQARLAADVHYCNLRVLNAVDKQVLMERHLISRELQQGTGDRGVAFAAATEAMSVMTNEEDHLRIQVIRSGNVLDSAFSNAVEIDRKLQQQVPYAFSERYGFLTACPTNVGTGLRVSVMMHLPALVIMDQMDKVFEAASKVGLTVRGFYGEGSKPTGDVIQISNQQTLGRSEEQILETVRNMVQKIVDYERGVRSHLIAEKRVALEDKVWRSMGMLRYARRITTEETMEFLSAVRLGVDLQLVPNVTMSDVNELFVITQPGHLQARKGEELSPERRDEVRATLLRERFKPESN